MKTILGKFIFILILTLAACTSETASPIAAPTATLDPVSLKLNWQNSVQFLGFYVADELGFYAEENLSITMEDISDPSETHTLPERVAEGDFDFSMGAVLLVNGQARGVPVTIISTLLQFSPNSFFVRADSGIQTPSDFAGRNIAIVSDDMYLTLEHFLESVDLTMADVNPIPASFDMSPFYNGEIEIWSGYITNSAIRARQTGLELVTFPLYEYGIEETALTIFTSQNLLENNPELAVRFLRASLRGWQWAIENPIEAVDLMLERFPELADNREFHLASFNAYIPLVRVPGIPIGIIDCERWLNDERLKALDSTDNLCTTTIFEQAINN